MGYAPAQFNYAMALNDGHGVTRNLKERDSYIKQAGANGYPLALKYASEVSHAPQSYQVELSPSSEGRMEGQRLKQDNLREVSLNADIKGIPRLEVSSFTGAEVALVDSKKDFVIFADAKGKLERYSASSGRKMWSFSLPAGTAVEGLYLTDKDGETLYVVSVGSNEVVHETSIWSVPLNGIGKARELAQFWEGGSESSAPGAGAIVEGHYKGACEFLVNFIASEEFDTEGPVARLAAHLFPNMRAGQSYQMMFNASTRTLQALAPGFKDYEK
jgi:hypothetical protein